jgi:hypothetical protein
VESVVEGGGVRDKAAVSFTDRNFARSAGLQETGRVSLELVGFLIFSLKGSINILLSFRSEVAHI